jgi:hypothetical protein
LTEPQANASFDPAELARTYAAIANRSSQLVSEFIARQGQGGVPAFGDELGIARHFTK